MIKQKNSTTKLGSQILNLYHPYNIKLNLDGKFSKILQHFTGASSSPKPRQAFFNIPRDEIYKFEFMFISFHFLF